MTRINTAPTAVPKPDSVVFGELAIAAGLAGQPVAVCYSESTAAVDCELWKYFWFIRVLWADVCKKVDKLLSFEGSISRFFNRSQQDVHADIVSRFWNSWLSSRTNDESRRKVGFQDRAAS